MVVEVATGDEWNAQRAEVIGTDHVEAELRVVAAPGVTSLDGERPAAELPQHQQRNVEQAYHLDTVHRTKVAGETVVKRATRLRVIAGRAHVHQHRGDVLRIESGIGMPRRVEAADDQRRRDEQDERHRHLPGDEQVPQP